MQDYVTPDEDYYNALLTFYKRWTNPSGHPVDSVEQLMITFDSLKQIYYLDDVVSDMKKLKLWHPSMDGYIK